MKKRSVANGARKKRGGKRLRRRKRGGRKRRLDRMRTGQSMGNLDYI
mgnify:CR=1 FL=1